MNHEKNVDATIEWRHLNVKDGTTMHILWNQNATAVPYHPYISL